MVNFRINKHVKIYLASFPEVTAADEDGEDWTLRCFQHLNISFSKGCLLIFRLKFKGCLHQDLFQLFKLCYKDFCRKLRHWFCLKMDENRRFQTLSYSTQTFNRLTRSWGLNCGSLARQRQHNLFAHGNIQTEMMHFHLFLHLLEHRWSKNMTNFTNDSKIDLLIWLHCLRCPLDGGVEPVGWDRLM